MAANPLTDAQLQALRLELASVQESIRKEVLAARQNLDHELLLGVFRLLPDMTPEDFRRLAGDVNLSAWVALPLDKVTYPNLARLQKTLEELAFRADHDGLTGLPNRRALERALDMEMERSRRDRTMLSLAMVDIDDFKKVNDTYGHPTGDKVLVALANIFASNIRRYDIAGRMGGEEFALLFPGIGRARAAKLLERLMNRFRSTEFTAENGDTFRVTCSAGLALFRGAGDMSVSDLIALADKALYEAKATGKDRIVRAPAPPPDPALKRTLVKADEKRFLFTGQPSDEDET